MTIEPKILFVERLKEELEDKLTFRDLKNVTRIATMDIYYSPFNTESPRIRHSPDGGGLTTRG